MSYDSLVEELDEAVVEAQLEGCDDGAPGWQTTLYVMWFAQMVAILGFSFVIPFMPFFIRDLGVADDKLVALWSGVLGAATGLAFSIAAPFWGAVADKYGRRPMVVRSMLGGALVALGDGAGLERLAAPGAAHCAGAH